MKRIVTFAVILAAFFTLSSCSSDSVPLANLTVTLSVPTEVEGFTIDVPSSEVEVTLTNTVDNSISTAITDNSGIAIFADKAAGNYIISTSIIANVGVNIINLVGNDPVTLVAGEDASNILTLVGSVKQEDLIISEIYTCAPEFIGLSYLQSKFIEIYNNTDKDLTTEGLILSGIAGRSGVDGNREWSASLPIGEYVYGNNVLRFPQDQIKTIAPGEGIVIALNAINYTDGLPVDKDPTKFADLSNSDFECYAVDYLQSISSSGNPWFDSDNANVTNMEILYMYNQNLGYSFINWATGGEAYVLYRNTDFLMSNDNLVVEPEDTADPQVQYLPLESKYIIDGVCVLENSSAANFRSLPSTVDASFTYCKEDGGPGNSGISIIRLKDEDASTTANRTILIDTNDSGSDFTQVTDPTPHVYGE
ncbi:MAG: DUF4876 domain-containing protein [Bacteroidales bacterium]